MAQAASPAIDNRSQIKKLQAVPPVLELYIRRDQALLVIDMVLEFIAIVLDESAHRHRRRIAQRADSAALDVIGDIVQEVKIFSPALAVLDTVDHAIQPAGALASWRALAARFFVVEIRQPEQTPDHAARLIHDDHRTRAEHR